MLISYEHRFIHIAVPRTGSRCTHEFLLKACQAGTWKEGSPPARQKLGLREFPRVGPHIGPARLRRDFPEEWKSFRKLINIRHPYTFCLSAFAWDQNIQGGQHQRPASTPPADADKHELACAYADFLGADKSKVLRDQKEYFLLDDAPIDMHLIRYEHLHEDLQRFSDQLALGLDVARDLPLERDIQSRPLATSAQWLGWTPRTLMNARAKALIDERYAWYFERFGYKKEIEDAA